MAGHRIILTGGGTGGHVYPALAVYEQLKNDPEVEKILYIGVKDHIEQRLAEERGIEFVGLEVKGLPRKISLDLLRWPGQLLKAIWRARKVIRLFHPTVILGTGGYAAAAPLIAAQLEGIAYIVHEPDAHPGLVNRLFANRAKLVSLGMEAAAARIRPSAGELANNGNPVAESFFAGLKRDSACAVLGLDPGLRTVLVTGGSQGAQALNESLLVALPSLLQVEPPIQIIHQAGDKNVRQIKDRLSLDIAQSKRYLLRPYFEDLSVAYAVSDLAVCRAGAMTISELAASGTPALFVPFPYAAANHQTHNAEYMASKGAALVLPQSQMTGQSLAQGILTLLDDGPRLASMKGAMKSLSKPQAASMLAEQVKAVSAAAVRR